MVNPADCLREANEGHTSSKEISLGVNSQSPKIEVSIVQNNVAKQG